MFEHNKSIILKIGSRVAFLIKIKEIKMIQSLISFISGRFDG